MSIKQINKEEEDEKYNEVLNSSLVVELSELIEQMLTEKPLKKYKKVYAEWKDKTNKLIDRCNKLAKEKIYAVIN